MGDYPELDIVSSHLIGSRRQAGFVSIGLLLGLAIVMSVAIGHKFIGVDSIDIGEMVKDAGKSEFITSAINVGIPNLNLEIDDFRIDSAPVSNIHLQIPFYMLISGGVTSRMNDNPWAGVDGKVQPIERISHGKGVGECFGMRQNILGGRFANVSYVVIYLTRTEFFPLTYLTSSIAR